jgi:hypothetical protein
MPIGQGSLAQQTPQPLQVSPSGGFGGAAAWSRMVRLDIASLCRFRPRAQRRNSATTAPQLNVSCQQPVLESPPTE